jgi:DNA replication protein DnaC
MQRHYPLTLAQPTSTLRISLPLWQWPKAELLAGHWIQVSCPTCEGSGSEIGIAGWRFPCRDCVGLVAGHLAKSGGIRTWQRYQAADLSTFEWQRLPVHLANLLQGYAETTEQHLVSGWGLMLTGGVGCGKTHLAVGMGIVALGLGFSVYATTLGELLLAIRASFQQEAEYSEAELLETVCGVDLLILDDLGMEKPTAWARERLAYVVNQRYAVNLATIVTTNLDLDVLEEQWSGRVMSRLYGAAQAVGLHEVTDYRRHQRQRYLEQQLLKASVKHDLLIR